MELDPELKLILSSKIVPMGKMGRPPCRATIIGRMLGVPLKHVKRNGLDRVQTSEAWLCRYSNMRYHQGREKRYKP